MKALIETSVEEVVRAAKVLRTDQALSFIEDVAKVLAKAYETQGKVLIAGNGGSLCDAMHFAEELTGFFREKRKPLGAIALSDPAHMSCVSNDEGFDTVFSRLVEAWGKEGDVVIVMSTSGNSKNIIKAVQKAKELGLLTVAFLGKSGGQLKGACDLEWIVNDFPFSDRIQEAHMAAIHIIIEVVEKLYFGSKTPVNLQSQALSCSPKP